MTRTRIELIGRDPEHMYCVSTGWTILGWFSRYEDARKFLDSIEGLRR